MILRALKICFLAGIPFVFKSSILGDTTQQWREVWEIFDQNYSYFIHKEVDWDAVWTEHAEDFREIEEGNAFAEHLAGILEILRDRHVIVRKPDGSVFGYSPEVEVNYPPTVLLPRYVFGEGFSDLAGNQVIIHGWLQPDIAYILVTTLGNSFTTGITEAHLNQLWSRYHMAMGWIVDLRLNAGGNEENARRFASGLTQERRTYGYTRTRIMGDNWGAFTDPNARTLEANSERPVYKGKVLGLIGQRTMSSGESFALMLRALPGGVLVGDTTRGASGNPLVQTLDSLGVEFTVSTWQAFDLGMRFIEDHGIQPDLKIPPGDSFDEDRDFVLEKAIAVIQAQSNPFGIPGEWVVSQGLDPELKADFDGDQVLDREEWIAGTDPRNKESFPQIRPFHMNSNALRIEFEGVSGRNYRLKVRSDVNGAETDLMESGFLQESGPVVWQLPLADRQRFLRLAISLP